MVLWQSYGLWYLFYDDLMVPWWFMICSHDIHHDPRPMPHLSQMIRVDPMWPCDPRDPRLHVSPLRYGLFSSPVFGGPFPEEGVCVQDTQGQVPGRSGGDRSDQPTVTQGFMKKQGYPPVEFFFLGPWARYISQKFITVHLLNLDQLSF